MCQNENAHRVFPCSILSHLRQIAGDIEANAKNLVDVLALQSEELSVVGAKLQHVKFQLQLVKETHATVELNKLRAPVRLTNNNDSSIETKEEEPSSAAVAGRKKEGSFGDRPVVEMLAKPLVKRQAWARTWMTYSAL